MTGLRAHGLLALVIAVACGARPVATSEIASSSESTTDAGEADTATTSTSDECESGDDSACEEMPLVFDVSERLETLYLTRVR